MLKQYFHLENTLIVKDLILTDLAPSIYFQLFQDFCAGSMTCLIVKLHISHVGHWHLCCWACCKSFFRILNGNIKAVFAIWITIIDPFTQYFDHSLEKFPPNGSLSLSSLSKIHSTFFQRSLFTSALSTPDNSFL